MPAYEILDDGSRREKIPPRKPGTAEFARLRALNASLADTLEAVQRWSWSLPLALRESETMQAVDKALRRCGRRP